MIFQDSFEVAAPIAEVWAFLQDISRVGACMPGAEEVAEVAPDTYAGKLKSKVGAVRAAFTGQVVIVERQAPERLVATIQAEDRALASFVTGHFRAHLRGEEGRTEVAYEVDVAVRGRLATVGYATMKQVARKMTLEFAGNLQQALGA